jgi:hypothetical protein
MREDDTERTLREAVVAGRRELGLFVAAFVAFVAIGAAVPEFMFSWVVGAGFLVLFVVGLPALARRLRA